MGSNEPRIAFDLHDNRNLISFVMKVDCSLPVEVSAIRLESLDSLELADEP
jgi:hypothetical protein